MKSYKIFKMKRFITWRSIEEYFEDPGTLRVFEGLQLSKFPISTAARVLGMTIPNVRYYRNILILKGVLPAKEPRSQLLPHLLPPKRKIVKAAPRNCGTDMKLPIKLATFKLPEPKPDTSIKSTQVKSPNSVVIKSSSKVTTSNSEISIDSKCACCCRSSSVNLDINLSTFFIEASSIIRPRYGRQFFSFQDCICCQSCTAYLNNSESSTWADAWPAVIFSYLSKPLVDDPMKVLQMLPTSLRDMWNGSVDLFLPEVRANWHVESVFDEVTVSLEKFRNDVSQHRLGLLMDALNRTSHPQVLCPMGCYIYADDVGRTVTLLPACHYLATFSANIVGLAEFGASSRYFQGSRPDWPRKKKALKWDVSPSLCISPSEGLCILMCSQSQHSDGRSHFIHLPCNTMQTDKTCSTRKSYKKRSLSDIVKNPALNDQDSFCFVDQSTSRLTANIVVQGMATSCSTGYSILSQIVTKNGLTTCSFQSNCSQNNELLKASKQFERSPTAAMINSTPSCSIKAKAVEQTAYDVTPHNRSALVSNVGGSFIHHSDFVPLLESLDQSSQTQTKSAATARYPEQIPLVHPADDVGRKPFSIAHFYCSPTALENSNERAGCVLYLVINTLLHCRPLFRVFITKLRESDRSPVLLTLFQICKRVSRGGPEKPFGDGNRFILLENCLVEYASKHLKVDFSMSDRFRTRNSPAFVASYVLQALCSGVIRMTSQYLFYTPHVAVGSCQTLIVYACDSFASNKMLDEEYNIDDWSLVLAASVSLEKEPQNSVSVCFRWTELHDWQKTDATRIKRCETRSIRAHLKASKLLVLVRKNLSLSNSKLRTALLADSAETGTALKVAGESCDRSENSLSPFSIANSLKVWVRKENDSEMKILKVVSDAPFNPENAIGFSPSEASERLASISEPRLNDECSQPTSFTESPAFLPSECSKYFNILLKSKKDMTPENGLSMLYPEKALFPHIFNRTLHSSVVGGLPYLLFMKKHPQLRQTGFCWLASLGDHLRVRLLNSDSLTSSDTSYIAFCFDVFLEVTLARHETLTHCKGLEHLDRNITEQEALPCIDHDIRNGKEIYNLASLLQNQINWSFFLTLTCSDTETFGVWPIRKAIEEIYGTEGELLQQKLQESCIVMCRAWERAVRYFFDYLVHSPERILGHVRNFWYRFVFDDPFSVGGLPSVDAGVVLFTDRDEDCKNKVASTIRELFTKKMRTDEASLLEARIIDNHEEYIHIQQLAASYADMSFEENFVSKTNDDAPGNGSYTLLTMPNGSAEEFSHVFDGETIADLQCLGIGVSDEASTSLISPFLPSASLPSASSHPCESPADGSLPENNLAVDNERPVIVAMVNSSEDCSSAVCKDFIKLDEDNPASDTEIQLIFDSENSPGSRCSTPRRQSSGMRTPDRRTSSECAGRRSRSVSSDRSIGNCEVLSAPESNESSLNQRFSVQTGCSDVKSGSISIEVCDESSSCSSNSNSEDCTVGVKKKISAKSLSRDQDAIKWQSRATVCVRNALVSGIHTNGRIMAAFRSPSNIQFCNKAFQSCYLAKYYAENEKKAVPILSGSPKIPQTEEHLGNVTCRPLPLTEMIWFLLLPFVGTNIEYVRVDTHPIDHRQGENETSQTPSEDTSILRTKLPGWRQFSPDQLIHISDASIPEGTRGLCNLATLFSVRPPELRLVKSLHNYCQWFTLAASNQLLRPEINLEQSPWIDGCGHSVRLRIPYLLTALMFFEKMYAGGSVCVDEQTEQTTLVEPAVAVLEAEQARHMHQLLHKLTQEMYSTPPSKFFLRFVDCGKDSHVSVVFSPVTPLNSSCFLRHLLLTLGRYETEIGLYKSESLLDAFQLAELVKDAANVGPEDVKSIARRYVTEQLAFLPVSNRQFSTMLALAIEELNVLCLGNSGI